MGKRQYELLALACPRSGTHYMTNVLRNCGIKVGHEHMKRHGTVGMFLAVEDCWYPGKHWHDDESVQGIGHMEFDTTIHFARDPRVTVPSIASMFFSDFVWCWQERHTGISCGSHPKKLRAMKFWLAWNELIEKNHSIDLFFRVEDIDNRWGDICDLLSIEGHATPPPTPRDMGSDSNPKMRPVPMTWDEMKSIDNETYERVREMAVRYGYEE